MIVAIVFYVLAAILVGSAAMVVTARSPVHAVLFLILAFFNAAGLFLIVGAEFLAMILVIVYVGAVAVLFLFVVMMLDVDFDRLREGFQRYAPVGVLLGIVLLVELVVALGMFGGGGVPHPAFAAAPIPTPLGAGGRALSNTAALGRLIYTDDILLFQSAGIILLIAMIGAIVLTLRDRRTAYRQDVAAQLARDPATAVRLMALPLGGGIGESGGIRRAVAGQRPGVPRPGAGHPKPGQGILPAPAEPAGAIEGGSPR